MRAALDGFVSRTGSAGSSEPPYSVLFKKTVKGGPSPASYALGTLVTRNMPLLRMLSLLAIIFIATYVLAQNHECRCLGGMNPTKWHEDLAVLREQMPKKHGNLFHSISREQYELALTISSGASLR